MILKLVFLTSCVGSVLGLQGGPAFPGSSASNAQAVAATLSSATASSAYKAKHSDEASAINRAVSAGSKTLTEQVASELALSSLKNDAFVAAHMAVRRYVHVGMCPRAYEGCPVGWVSADGGCSPGSNYDGFCGARSFSGTGVAQKEDFAFRCGVSWPCADSTASYDSACPRGWKASESGCIAPSSYAGICSPATNFSGWSAESKARWAAMCGAPF